MISNLIAYMFLFLGRLGLLQEHKIQGSLICKQQRNWFNKWTRGKVLRWKNPLETYGKALLAVQSEETS